MAVDKKNAGKSKRIVLLSAIGRTYEPKATAVPDSEIQFILSDGVTLHPAIPSSPFNDCTPPGSKSISNRVLLLAALGSGTCRITNLLHSDDTQVMLTALTQLHAASYEWADEGKTLIVTGAGGKVVAPEEEIYLGNAGTASRFLATVTTLATANTMDFTILTGNARMKERPIGPLIDSLRTNGVDIEYQEKSGSLPLRVSAAGGFNGGEIELAASVSSQYVSSILICAPYARNPVVLKLTGGKVISQPYIDMTIAMMRSFGVKVEKSSSEENTYHIPNQAYKNPSNYQVESDASSATYPLAVAAITGTTRTVPNIGSSSLQGDAKFAVDVLRPMGCKVEQTETSTTVTGPPLGQLKALPEVDMEPMTDAFLTASVLAAAAQSGTTRITGIANQRVKECNRIAAMKDQLAKFGVTCREHDDGIEIDAAGQNIKSPSAAIHCYDDHRVAMSFSVLSFITPQRVILDDRHCVSKTWPGWWDTLSQLFGASLKGVDLSHSPGTTDKDRLTQRNQRSIFVVGMRGVGKTTTGRATARAINWPFVDLDVALEKHAGKSIPEIIETRGWEGFRSLELDLIRQIFKTHSQNHVIACGGGIVEIPEARELLQKHMHANGIVLLVTRDIGQVVKYLNKDKTRPAYVEDIMSVWLRRRTWYEECSNYQYYNHSVDRHDAAHPFSDLGQFLTNIRSDGSALQTIRERKNSFFVSLTSPDMRESLLLLPKVIVGADAAELRVDLLHDPNSEVSVPSPDFVIEQIACIRSITDLPIVFTVRSRSQGGKFPDDQIEAAAALYYTALRMAIEFVDIEVTAVEPLMRLVPFEAYKESSKIIASHHDPTGQLSWSNGSWIPFFNRALQYGDVIKLIGLADSTKDNFALAEFKAWAAEEYPDLPMIVLNMGPEGQLSRILNGFMTPVSHPALPAKAAPGQLSAAQIRQGLSLLGQIQPRKWYLFGSPIAQSRSPALHNALFQENGLPHHYERFETDNLNLLKPFLKDPDFGGASITIPLKLEIMPLLDAITADAKTIGAVNTIITKENDDGTALLIGDNTDWLGMRRSLHAAGATTHTLVDDNTTTPHKSQSALIIGGGGTARAAIYALHNMGYTPIHIIGRDRGKIDHLISSFPKTYKVHPLCSVSDVASVTSLPTAAIGTIPADQPIDSTVREILCGIFEKCQADDDAHGHGLHHLDHGHSHDHNRGHTHGHGNRLLLEMAYKPRLTALMRLAEDHGWRTIPGLEALAGQGVYQFEKWTGIKPLYGTARGIVLGEETHH